MNIGDAAELSGLPAKTIRYYESVGLIVPDRGENDYRDFAETDIHMLTFVARARSLGFPIQDCRTLLSLYEDQERASADVKRIAEVHLSAIDRKIHELEGMRSTLRYLFDHCMGNHRPDCPILDDMAGATATAGS